MLPNYAIEIKTTPTSNGVSRQGFLVYRSDSVLLGFLDCCGNRNTLQLHRMFPCAVITLCSLKVTPGEFRSAQKGPQLR